MGPTRTRDYVRYRYKQGGKVSRFGITTDPGRREEELRKANPNGRLERVGRRVTKESAQAWEREQIAAAFKEKGGLDRMSAEEVDALGEASAEAMGGLEQMGLDMERFNRSDRYLTSIIPLLREQNPDCWVAVRGEKVVGVEPNLKALLKSLDKQGAPRGDVAIRYVSKEPMRMIV